MQAHRPPRSCRCCSEQQCTFNDVSTTLFVRLDTCRWYLVGVAPISCTNATWSAGPRKPRSSRNPTQPAEIKCCHLTRRVTEGVGEHVSWAREWRAKACDGAQQLPPTSAQPVRLAAVQPKRAQLRRHVFAYGHRRVAASVISGLVWRQAVRAGRRGAAGVGCLLARLLCAGC